jgi:hypothetical protein
MMSGGMNNEEREKIPDVQLQLRSGSRLMQFRELGVSCCHVCSINSCAKMTFLRLLQFRDWFDCLELSSQHRF